MKYNRWKRNPNEDAAFATQVREHYAACVTYADAQVGKVLRQLDQLEIAKRNDRRALGRPRLAPGRTRHLGKARPL